MNKSGSNGSGQFNRGGGSSGMKCFGCGETGHKLAKCKKTTGKKALFVKAYHCDDTKLDIEGGPVYDKDAVNEVLLEGDVGTALVVWGSGLTPKATEEDDWLRNNIFQSTCIIKDKVCLFVIDGGSCKNIVSVKVIEKLNSHTEKHPKPYKLAWLKKGDQVVVHKRALVPFSIGMKYKDTVWCDVVAMDAFHLLLGRPWQYDRDVIHNGWTNTYSFS